MFKFLKNKIDEAKIFYGAGIENATQDFTKKINKLFINHDTYDDDFFEEFEEMLIMADIMPNLAIFLRQELEKKIYNEKTNSENFAEIVKEVLKSVIVKKDSDNLLISDKNNILLVTGVNGVGKTTTIAKMTYLYNKDYKVLLAAGDTFRAGAIEQIETWGQRLNTPVVSSHSGHDPSALVFDAIKKMQEENFNLLICDTAGRLHNKDHLMSELEKIKKTITKNTTNINLKNLLVIDGTIGKNSLDQVAAFNEITPLDGIVISKMDAKAKVGLILNILYQFPIPIYFLGSGEQPKDLKPFDLDIYLDLLMEGLTNHEA